MRKAIIIVGSQENFRLEGTSGSLYSKLLSEQYDLISEVRPEQLGLCPV